MAKKKAVTVEMKRYRAGLCMNCGEKGPHYVPPTSGFPGMYSCKKKPEK